MVNKILIFTAALFFAIPLFASANTYATLNPFDKGSGATLSGSNLIITDNLDSGVWSVARSTISVTSGKWYYEFYPTHSGNIGGVANSLATLDDFVGSDSNGWGIFDGGGVYHGGSNVDSGVASYVPGDKIGVGIDMDSGVVYFYKNCSEVSSQFIGAGPYFAGLAVVNNGSETVNFGATSFLCSVPSGYNPGLYTVSGGGGGGGGGPPFSESLEMGTVETATIWSFATISLVMLQIVVLFSIFFMIFYVMGLGLLKFAKPIVRILSR